MGFKRSASNERDDQTEESSKKPYVPRYTPGKHPRSDPLPKVDYIHPLDPTEELISDLDWTIPKLNLFIAFTLDNLVDAHKAMFKDFIKLPSRKFHPQYYYKIDQPISINEIKNRDYEYSGGETKFLLDCELIYKNCAAYNDTDTLIVKNSKQVVFYIKNEVLKVKNATRNFLVNEQVKERLLVVLNSLLDSTDKRIAALIEKDGGSGESSNLDDTLKVCEPFLELVDKSEYPDYYEVIRQPLALNLVKSNLELGYYSKIYDFITDVNLTLQNALVFNDENTTIYSDASKLLKCFNALLQKEFFPELEAAREKGEISLEYDKIEYQQFVEEEEQEPILSDEEDETNEEYNHIEGLGNGYNRGPLSRDYLLGPKRSQSSDVKVENDESEKPQILKFNILPVLKKHNIEPKLHDTFTIIDKIQITSSRSFYEQSIRSLQGLYQQSNDITWFEYIFAGSSLSKEQNEYAITLPPLQNSITFIAHLNCKTSAENPVYLLVNKDNVNTTPVLNEDNTFDDAKARYDVRLSEGLNTIEFNIKEDAKNSDETVKFWINVLP